MQGEDNLEKWHRINALFDFYGPLLTERQQTFLRCYFHDDYSLGEIAAEFQISRQAVYEHLKRAEAVLEDYECKLGLAARHADLHKNLDALEREIDRLPVDKQKPLREALMNLRGN